MPSMEARQHDSVRREHEGKRISAPNEVRWRYEKGRYIVTRDYEDPSTGEWRTESFSSKSLREATRKRRAFERELAQGTPASHAPQSQVGASDDRRDGGWGVLPAAPRRDRARNDHLAGLGARLRSARRARGLTQEQLAEFAGIKPSDLSYMENGRRMPRVETTMRRLAAALGVDWYWLLAGDGRPAAE